jgi:thiosulfate dehydrogenase [quinone] large subunit
MIKLCNLSLKMSNQQLAFLLARITFGINLFIHGLVRIPKLNAFTEGVTQGFQETMLPLLLVKPLAYAIPVIELLLGLAILLGIWTRKSLVASAIFIIILISGSAFQENWSGVSTQMLYALFIFFLIKNEEFNVCYLTKNSKKNIHGFTTKK